MKAVKVFRAFLLIGHYGLFYSSFAVLSLSQLYGFSGYRKSDYARGRIYQNAGTCD